MNLENFRIWAAADPGNRSVDISIDRRGEISIWAYDYKLMTGQHVQSVEEIDLEGKKEADELKKYKELKRKYEAKGE